ncbi:MAG: glutathione S-transferase C-terminal domain-containing protein [Gammaproteobacteria bacterium]
MIDLHYWPTPNGWKISIALEEMELPYRTVPVNIGAGDQFKPEFLRIAPNNRMPAIVDHAPSDGGEPVSVFESGAILVYLADKSGKFMPKELRGKVLVTQWLMWQMGGLGPMFGQDGHFKLYAPEKLPYAIDRYDRECRRLLGVMDGQLQRTGDCLAGEYSIADMAVWPWLVTAKRRGIDLAGYPAVQNWFARLRARPAVQRGMALLQDLRNNAAVDDAKAREVLFGIKPA